MRHQKATLKLNRTSSHRRAMLRNMATSLFEHERIQTTTAKAKALRPYAEKLITLGKRGDLHARRLVARDIKDNGVVQKLFETLAQRYADRAGGYTRILHVGARRGDNADVALIELVDAQLATAAPAEVAAEK